MAASYSLIILFDLNYIRIILFMPKLSAKRMIKMSNKFANHIPPGKDTEVIPAGGCP